LTRRAAVDAEAPGAPSAAGGRTRPFADLSPAGKQRRVAALALAALERYDLRVRSVRVHAFATNLLYRVRSDTGERLMLRMAVPGWRTLSDLEAEAAWLEALQRETDLGAPAVVRASSGEAVLSMRGPGIPDVWHATLMTWVDGRLLAHHLDDVNVARLGELFARLHAHGKAWTPPAGFTDRRFEAFLSRGERDVLFGDGAIDELREDDRSAFLRARGWVERAYAALDRGDLRVIHCDLWHENVKLDRGSVRPFDFEDTVWGYRLHDLAMGLLDLLETVGPERYPDLLAACRSGYERRLAWPEGDLEPLQIGRLLWKANYVARVHRASFGRMGEAYGRAFRAFEEGGGLRLPT
jgi:Ser/Thr protein kinase RdoA (MazF antagonist)